MTKIGSDALDGSPRQKKVKFQQPSPVAEQHKSNLSKIHGYIKEQQVKSARQARINERIEQEEREAEAQRKQENQNSEAIAREWSFSPNPYIKRHAKKQETSVLDSI